MSQIFNRLKHFLKREQPPLLLSLKSVSFIGQGAFGIVLKCVDKSDKSTAIKLLFPQEADENELRNIRRECVITTQLQRHENLVNIIEATAQTFSERDLQVLSSEVSNHNRSVLALLDGEIAIARRHKRVVDVICIEMELCGENLNRWLAEEHDSGELKLQQKQVAITINIIDGLKYLHDNKIIHRDLKPENIMFSKEGYILPVKIGDFGLSRKIHSGESQLTSRIGTADYMAPECFTGFYTQQADLYSLGLIVWEVFQLIPFRRRKGVFDRLVNDREESLVHRHPLLGENIREVVIGLTKKRSRERFPNVDHLMNITQHWKDLHISPLQIPVHNTQELKSCLENAPIFYTIILREGIYEGHFILRQSNITIIGETANTLIKCDNATCFNITGNQCKISCIQIVAGANGRNLGLELNGFQNNVNDVVFSGGCCLEINGNSNVINHSKMSNAYQGIAIRGNNNRIENLQLMNVSGCGILALDESSDNVFAEICGESVKDGIYLNGMNNLVLNAKLTKTSTERNFRGMVLLSGSNHIVDNLVCSGYILENNDLALRIYAENCMIKNSECEPLEDKGRNTTFKNEKLPVLAPRDESLELALMASNLTVTSATMNLQTYIGNGAFGIVFEETDLSGKLIAVKILFTEIASKYEQKQIRREYNIPRSLEHKNLVRVLGFQIKKFTKNEIEKLLSSRLLTLKPSARKYLIRINQHFANCEVNVSKALCINMELCGKDLSAWLAEDLDANDSEIQLLQLNIALDIISGLKYLHNNDIMHRDLKPKNIMFANFMYTLPVKIGDFGLCREDADPDPMTLHVGTSPYMAPEIVAGEDFKKPSDLFSLGLVIWEVAQRIQQSSHKDKADMFRRLYDKKEVSLVKDHALMTGVADVIIGLTKFKLDERTQHINDLESYTKMWENIARSYERL